MNRLEQLKQIKKYDKDLKQKCKSHRQVQIGYSIASTPIKKQLAKNVELENYFTKPALSYEKVEDPYMHSIELAESRKLDNYVFKNPEMFLINVNAEDFKKNNERFYESRRHPTTTPETSQTIVEQPQVEQQDENFKKSNEEFYQSRQQTTTPTQPVEQTTSPTQPPTQDIPKQANIEGRTLSPELYSQGWRILEQAGSGDILYYNPTRNIQPQTEYPELIQHNIVPRHKEGENALILYTSRGVSYYYNRDTALVSRTIPAGYTEDDVVNSTYLEREENARFTEYYKPQINQLTRGEGVLPNLAIERALKKQINSINATPVIRGLFNDEFFLLDTNLSNLSRKELIKQFKSIVNILAENEQMIHNVMPSFNILTSINNQWKNRVQNNYQLVDVDNRDEIIESTSQTEEGDGGRGLAEQPQEEEQDITEGVTFDPAEFGEVTEFTEEQEEDITEEDLIEKFRQQILSYGEDITEEESNAVWDRFNEQFAEITDAQPKEQPQEQPPFVSNPNVP
jgi:hypothetical protein